MRKFWMVVKIAGGVLVVAAIAVAAHVARTWDRVWDVPVPGVHASQNPEIIARGDYLVFGPAHCVECHVSDVKEYDRFFATGERPALRGGYPFDLGPLGRLYSKNLTPDPETGIGRYTDGQIARMLRHAVRPDGRASIGDLMPFSEMSDEDLVAIISFLRSQPPVRHQVPTSEWTLFGKVMKSFVPAALPKLDGHPPATSPVAEPTLARGQYLARSVANCGGCHSPFNEMTGAPTGPRFSGGNVMESMLREGADPSLGFRPPNITPRAGSGLMNFPDRATFVARFKVGGRKHLGSPMPWEAFSRMSPEDVGSLYEYLHSLAPEGEPSPREPTVRR